MALEAYLLGPAPPPPRAQLRARRPALSPAEHGSWSLALEPVALGLLIAPARPSVLLAAAALAAFLARRPLKLLVRGRGRPVHPATVAALLGSTGAAAAALGLDLWLFRGAWIAWLAPTALAGLLYLIFDLQNRGRHPVAEVAGAVAFGFLPAAMASAAGLPGWPGAAAAIACGRSVPTILFVRAYLRQERGHLGGRALPWTAALAALAAAFVLADAGLAPGLAVVGLAALAVRTGLYLNRPRPRVGARFLGFQELILGAAFVLIAGLRWPR